MPTQHDQHKPPAKWPQFIGPIIILLLAIGAAIFGILWSSDETNTAPTQDTPSAEDPGNSTQPDATAYLEQARQEFPDAQPEEHEALAAAQAEADSYIVSEHLLGVLLTDPEYEYGFSQTSAEFAVEHVEVDWNEHARQFATLAREEFPDATDQDLEQLLQHEPGGPQYSAEQTEYALSHTN